jgi:NAD+ synthase
LRVSEIVEKGHDLETVKKIERLLYLAEYKRRQSAPGVKVTRKNFGRDRRYPIVNRFRDQGLVAHRTDEALERATGKPRMNGTDV